MLKMSHFFLRIKISTLRSFSIVRTILSFAHIKCFIYFSLSALNVLFTFRYLQYSFVICNILSLHLH